MPATAIPRLSATAIADVLEAAAKNHPTPVDPRSLLDVAQSRRDQNLRAHLCALVVHRLYCQHGQRVCHIAKALGATPQTVRTRLRLGARLIRRTPWKQTYQSLP